MAYGRRAYLRQAKHLAMSLRLHSPTTTLALVTDHSLSPVSSLFDTVIPIQRERRNDGRPKLDVDLHTPFARTLLVDADGLAVRDVEFLFHRFRDQEFVVLGRNITSGYWYSDVAGMCELASAPAIPKFNGGFLYFTKSDRVRSVFADARALADQYDDLGYDKFNGGIADEPLLAIALARHRVEALPTMPDASVSLLGLTSRLEIDVVKGRVHFMKNHRPMAPAIVHFAADFSSSWRRSGAAYRRECRRVRRTGLARDGRLRRNS